MNTATKAQTDLLAVLIREREGTEQLAEYARDAWRLGALSKAAAGDFISAMKAFPKADLPEPEAGIYRINGDRLVRIYLGQQSGRMLAKGIRFDRGTVSYEYLGAASRVLTPGTNPEKLTVEEVGELGKSFDHCLMCGRRLDDPESVDRGIGPICAEKYA